MNKKYGFLSIIYLVLLLIHSTSPAKIQAINFAVIPNHSPFVAFDRHIPFYGVDIDIAKAICKKLGIQYTFNNDAIENMSTTLKSNKYDAWIGAININNEQKNDVSFTDPYFSGTMGLLATKQSTFSSRHIEIKNKIIGVTAETIYASCLKNIYGNSVKIKTFPQKNAVDHESCSILTEDMLHALKSGEIDAIIYDKSALIDWRLKQKDSNNYRLIDMPALNLDSIKQTFVIAVAKNNKELLNAFNKAIADIKTDGTYDTILKKYF